MSKPFIASETEGARSEGDRKATEILKEDHAKVKGLFKEYRGLEKEGEDREKQRLFGEIDRALSMHATVEEEIFYPAVKALDTEEPVEEVLEAREEHQIVKTLLGQLRDLTAEDETFDPKMKVLMEAVEHHAEEEEKEMFSSAKKGLGDEDLLRLGALIEERKRSLENGRMAQPAARAAEAPRPQGSKRPTTPARKR
jgi:hemerythrin superfamily protein